MRYLPILLAALAGGRVAAAQAVHGRVLGADSAAVPGAIVTLLDARGTGLARALADERGRFNFRMAEPGEYRVEVQRIGYATYVDQPFRVRAGEVAERLLLSSASGIALPTHVPDVGACIASDTATAGAWVWAEVRKALSSAQLTRLTRAYSMDVEMYVSRTSADRSQPGTLDRSDLYRAPLRALTSVPSTQLAAAGYVTRSGGGDRYHAPDDGALLSESFAATHCVRLLPYAEGDTVLRLGFTPAPDRVQPEIRGMISVDRGTLELQRVDFVYTNLRPTEFTGEHGGSVVFQRLPEGSWIISGWSLALPFAEHYVRQQATPATVNRRGVSTPARPALVLTGLGRVISGGGVTHVRFGDTSVWSTGEVPVPRPPVTLPP